MVALPRLLGREGRPEEVAKPSDLECASVGALEDWRKSVPWEWEPTEAAPYVPCDPRALH